MAQLTEWLQLMVAEINRKREDAERERAEEQARQKEARQPASAAAPTPEKVRA
jgi:hypothetical protein